MQPPPRIGPWRDALDGLLAGNEGKPARERLAPIRIFEELRSQGYEGSYDALRRYAKGRRRAQATMTAAAYVPLSFAPGEANPKPEAPASVDRLAQNPRGSDWQQDGVRWREPGPAFSLSGSRRLLRISAWLATLKIMKSYFTR